MKIKWIGISLVLFWSTLLYGLEPLPEGLWRTYDEKGVARSIVQFYYKDKEVNAKILKVLSPSIPHNNQVGLTIIEHLKVKENKWVQGVVIDPDSGQKYSCDISLSEDKTKLFFHAYMGFPLLGKTITWEKEINSLL